MASYRQILREIALDQYGYVTTEQAAMAKVPAIELPKLASRGGLTHIGRGLYRFDDIPATQLDQYMEATLLAGPGSALAGTAVLAMHELGLVEPKRLMVVTPKRIRAKTPPFINIIKRDLSPNEIVYFEGIPTTSVHSALRESEKTVMGERLGVAVRDAYKKKLITAGEAKAMRTRLKAFT